MNFGPQAGGVGDDDNDDRFRLLYLRCEEAEDVVVEIAGTAIAVAVAVGCCLPTLSTSSSSGCLSSCSSKAARAMLSSCAIVGGWNDGAAAAKAAATKPCR